MGNWKWLSILKDKDTLYAYLPEKRSAFRSIAFSGQEREREIFYLTTHSTHFIYGYMASDILLRTILIVRKETRCRHIGYLSINSKGFLYASSHRQDNTYHGLCYTRLEREIAQWVHPMKDRSDYPSHHERTLYLWAMSPSPSGQESDSCGKETKFLGVIFDRKLSFIPHLKYVKKKALKALNILNVVGNTEWGADRKVMLRLYRSLIRSNLDYGCIVYGSARKSYLQMLDPIHNQGLRHCLGAFQTSPVRWCTRT